ncbi:HutP family protein [Neomoorella humiferrea]|uniref:Hut operon positive regulatory protein n=1 Tax=Neomoorella humiferrea TaxID=676965 RepID=A0A2T0ASD5_9FIRM|nr:HutP family protein [Moorella humiferrea]PRR73148.1 anti-terminator HutP [Moorella humiferrea]
MIYGRGMKEISLGRAALILAMTENREREEEVKKWLGLMGYPKAVATEVSGTLSEFKQKVVKNAVTAALNTGVIDNEPEKIHSVVHAALEALCGIELLSMANPSLKVKLSIVADDKWLAVGMFGMSAAYPSTNHERAGLGIMHL